MRAVKSKWLTFAKLMILTGACGDSGGNNDGDNDGGGNNNNGTANDGGNTGDGGGKNDGGLPAASECGYKQNGVTDTSAAGGCYYFYCYLNEETLRAATTPGACTSDKDVALQCDGQPVRTVAQCARENVGVFASSPIETREARFLAAVIECARKDARLTNLSEGCLDCNAASAVCAAKECIAECAPGDSAACDKCREGKGCTPAFYTCAGFPDPNQ